MTQISRFGKLGEFATAEDYVPASNKAPYIEMEYPEGMQLSNQDKKGIIGYRTHLPIDKMPRKVFDDHIKVVNVLRNPKDVAISEYYMYQATSGLGNFAGGWKIFFEMFVTGNVIYGSWFPWVKNWYMKCKDNSNVLFITYEQLKENPKEMIGTLAKFIGVDLTEDVLFEIAKQTSFKYMKEKKTYYMIPNMDLMVNEEISPFLRKGVVGDWKTHFTVEQNEIFDRLFDEEMVHFKEVTDLMK